MAKSKIIKDIANGTIDIETSLKRAKVLLSEFQKKEILQWVQNELEGYREGDILPDYRKTQGILMGDFIIAAGFQAMKYTGVAIPLGNEMQKLSKDIEMCNIYQSIAALKKSLESGDRRIGKPIPANFYPALTRGNNITSILSAYVRIDDSVISDIFPAVENKLLDILLLLEKEFGNLDELDIDLTCKAEEEVRSIENKLYMIIFNDDSITIGDNNKIKDSDIISRGTLGNE